MLVFFPAVPRVDFGTAILTVLPNRDLVHETRDGRMQVPVALRDAAADPAPFDSIARAVVASVETRLMTQ